MPSISLKLLCVMTVSGVLVFLLRDVGVLLVLGLCSILIVTGSGAFVGMKRGDVLSLIKVQTGLFLLVLLVAWPFSRTLMESGLSPYLADLAFVKLPADKVILSISSDAETYASIREQIERPVWYQQLYLESYPAIHLAILVAMTWFSVAAPLAFAWSNADQEMNDNTAGIDGITFRQLLQLVLISGLSAMMRFDDLFIPGWSGRTTVAPLLNPFLILVVLLAFVPELVRTYLLPISARKSLGG